MKIRAKLIKFFSTCMSLLAANTANSYDDPNFHKFPKFELETPSREFQYLSIHPNGEDWLITESSHGGQILLYNLKTNRLQRFELPGDYEYTFATFSPSGKKIALVRKQRFPGDQVLDRIAELKTSQIAFMDRDGSHFRVLPIPSAIIVSVAISPDERKIAYWVGKTIRKPGSKTLVADFDIREFNFATNNDELFSGPFNFFGINGIYYLDDSILVAGASAPRALIGKMENYEDRFNQSEIYRLTRRQSGVPDPIFFTNYYAHSPAIDRKKNIYVIDYPKKTGRSITRKTSDGKSVSWQTPNLNGCSIYGLSPSPEGDYIAFIYGQTTVQTGQKKFAIGVLDVGDGIWTSKSIPSSDTASPIAVTAKLP